LKAPGFITPWGTKCCKVISRFLKRLLFLILNLYRYLVAETQDIFARKYKKRKAWEWELKVGAVHVDSP
jgi:hypothetical protein